MTRNVLLLLPALLTAWPACTPSQDVDAWREVSPADDREPTDSQLTQAPSSLGDPFVLVAQAPSKVAGMPNTPAATTADDAWVMLESDACDVVLRSLHTAFFSSDGGSLRSVTSVAPSTGVVQEASADLVWVRHRVRVRSDDGEGGFEEGIATVDMHITEGEPGGLVHVRGSLDLGKGVNALQFEASGMLNASAGTVPDRRFGCW